MIMIKRLGRRLASHAVVAAVLGVTVAGGLGVAGAAVASIPDGNGVIHSCYPATGTVHALGVIDTAQTAACPTGDKSLTFNQTGPRGATGATGPQGPAGPAGPSGISGIYTNSYSAQIPANYYDGITVYCNNTGDHALSGGMGDSLSFGSSGALLETYPSAGYGWTVWFANEYSSPETFTIYVVCTSGPGSAGAARPGHARHEMRSLSAAQVAAAQRRR